MNWSGSEEHRTIYASMMSKHVSRLSEPISGEWNHQNEHNTIRTEHIPINPIMEDVVESSVGGLVPSRPDMFPNRYNRSDEVPGVLRRVASLNIIKS